MYFSYGLPLCLDAGDIPPSESLVHAVYTDDHLLVVFSSRIQAWSAGQHRIKLGEVVVGLSDLEKEGRYVAAAWCQSRHRLALVVRNRGWGWAWGLGGTACMPVATKTGHLGVQGVQEK
jgi:hypothetical protein